VQFGTTETLSIAGLELFVGVKAEATITLGDGFHPPQAEGSDFRFVVDWDVDFMAWGTHFGLDFLRGRPGLFRFPLTPGRPAITPVGASQDLLELLLGQIGDCEVLAEVLRDGMPMRVEGGIRARKASGWSCSRCCGFPLVAVCLNDYIPHVHRTVLLVRSF